MSTPKLTYFDGRGRAEVPRLLFALADVAYEDNRIAREKWPELKPNTPFGQIPTMEIDGLYLCQCVAMSRYIARKHGLAGKDDKEGALMDMVVYCVEDMYKALAAGFYEQDEKKKAELKKKFNEEQLPLFVTKFEKLLTTNDGGNSYFVGNQISWADVYFYHYIDTCVRSAGGAISWDKAPKLKALKDRVESNPKIAAWIAKRPDTPF